MAGRRQRRADDVQAALDGSACLGAWTHHARSSRLAISPAFAAAVGLASDEAVIDVARDAVLAGIQDADRLRIESVLQAAAEAGDPFEAEFRTLDGVRRARWIRVIVRAEFDLRSGTGRTRGLAFDLTAARLAGRTAAKRAHRQVNQLADHVIAMQGLVAELRNPPLLRLVEQRSASNWRAVRAARGRAAGSDEPLVSGSG